MVVGSGGKFVEDQSNWILWEVFGEGILIAYVVDGEGISLLLIGACPSVFGQRCPLTIDTCLSYMFVSLI